MSRFTRLGAAFGLAMGIAGLVYPVSAQQPGGAAGGGAATPAPTTPGGAGGGNMGTNPGRNSIPSTLPNPNDNRNQFPEMQRPIFLSGRVMLDSGGPPPDSVSIERVCNGSPRAEGYTDTKGHFSFQLGQNMGVMQDASMGGADRGMPGFGGASNNSRNNSGFGGQGGGFSERDLMGCDIRASLAGYRSDVVSLAGRRMFDNPDLGTIVLHRLGNVEGTTISASSLNAPKDAKKSFDKANDLMKKKKTAEAQKEFEKAVEIYPRYAAAWYGLGRAREAQNNTDGARQAYAQALNSDAKYLLPYRQLVGIAVKEQNWQEVAETSGKLVKLDPVDFPEAHYYNSVANYFLKNYDAAEKSIREAQKLDTQNKMAKSSQLLGEILIQKQDYVGAAEQIRKYITVLPVGPEADSAKKQLAELERVTGTAKPAAEQ